MKPLSQSPCGKKTFESHQLSTSLLGYGNSVRIKSNQIKQERHKRDVNPMDFKVAVLFSEFVFILCHVRVTHRGTVQIVDAKYAIELENHCSQHIASLLRMISHCKLA